MEKLSNLFDKRQLNAYFCMVFSGLIETLSAACAQGLKGALPPLELNAVRYACQIVLALCLVVGTRASVKTIVDAHVVPWLLILTLCGFLFNTLHFTAAAYIPLGNLMVTHMVTMYISCVVFLRVVLQRETHLVQYAVFLFILVGEVLLIQPWFHPNATGHYYTDSSSAVSVPPPPLAEPNLTNVSNVSVMALPLAESNFTNSSAVPLGLPAPPLAESNFTNSFTMSVPPPPPLAESNLTLQTGENLQSQEAAQVAQSMQLYGYVLAMGAAIASSLRTFIYMTSISQVPTSVLVLGVGAIAFVTSALLSLYLESPILWLSTGDTLLLTGHALTTSISSLLVVNAQKVLQPVIYSILQNCIVPFSFIAQFSFPDIFIGGNSNMTEITGAVIVVVGIIGYILIDQRIKRLWSGEDF